MSTPAVTPRPEFGKIFGITYDRNTRLPMVRTPRVLKVGIGIPKGKAVHIFMHNGDWIIRFGVWEQNGEKKKLVMKSVYRGNTKVKDTVLSNKRVDVEAWYNAHKDEAAFSNRPQKIPHFTFTRRSIVEVDGKPVEMFEPDFEAIEAHGDAPRRIPVILTSDSPLHQELSFWSATELKCHGDGILAERVVSMGSAKDDNWKEAKDRGDKMFVYSPCGKACQYLSKECKPHSTLNIQLAYAMRLGATAYFTTTGIVSAGQLFSSLTEISEAVHRRGMSICGIPMDLVLGSFRANFEGKPAIQPCVSLELRAAGQKELNRILAENAWVPVKLEEGARQITGVTEDATIYDAEPETIAPGMAAEFSDAEFDDSEPVTEEASPAATATAAKTEALSDKLEKARKAKSEPVAESTPTQHPTSPVAPAVTETAPKWLDRQAMNADFNKQKARIGQEAFDGLLSKHTVLMGSLKHDDPKSAALFADMVAAPMATNESDVF